MYMNKFVTSGLYLFFVMAGLTSQAQKTHHLKAQKVDKLMQYCFEQRLFNGSVLVIENGQLLYQKSFGYADLHQQKPIDKTSQFLLASLSKQFTAMGIVLLNAQNKLDYDAPVTQYLGNFPYKNVTIRHLLNHSSGIPEYTKKLNRQVPLLKRKYEQNGQVFTNKHLVALYQKHAPPLDFVPGKSFRYSNTGYVFLAEIIEKVSRMTFGNFMQKHIFKPLNMQKTLVYNIHHPKALTRRVVGYKWALNGQDRILNDQRLFFNVVGDGGIYSTIEDLQKWDKALYSNTLVSQKALQEVFGQALLTSEQPKGYSFGWFVRKLPFNDHHVLTHSGEIFGFSNSFFRDITQKNTIILLGNNSHKYRREINQAMMRILYNLPYRLPKKHIHELLAPIIFSQGIAKAITTYDKVKSQKNNAYSFAEQHLNRLGYDLLKKSMIDEAIEVFRLNVKSYPQSANVYDSLAEAYLSNGQKDLALKYYKKAVVLDPYNNRVLKIIKQLEN